MVLEKTNYVDMAENAVKRLERNKNGNLILTTSKIRNMVIIKRDFLLSPRKA